MAQFDKNKIGDLRPNQIITTFGPGSIVDAVKDSVTVLDINYWKDKGTKITDARLASYLGVDCFYMPQTSTGGDIPIISFPYSHVCSKCGRIFDVRENFNLDKYLKYGVSCPDCHWQAYPSRFIVMCENGHIDDFPYSWWAHFGNTTCNGRIRTYSIGNTSSLSDMWVECMSCHSKRSMGGAMQKEAFSSCSCGGKHPFRPNAKITKCTKPVIPSQRGASNVYFSVVRSAISIPPWVNPLYSLIEEHQKDLDLLKKVLGEDKAYDALYEQFFKEKYSRKEFDDALKNSKPDVKEYTQIKQMEYDAITHHSDPAFASNPQHFKAEEDPLPKPLDSFFSRVIRITRLREVKVQLGFTRVDASDPEANAEEQPNIVSLHKNGDEKWLPAAQVHGEGVFIEFNRNTINQWLNNPDVKGVSDRYEETYKDYCERKGWQILSKRDAAYVLMHTFSHLLIKQMAMSSGYSSSAIRERIYYSEKMSGILLYTGSADKEGSLGGLVELGYINKLLELMQDAFREALLCTNDPECMNHMPAGDNANGAACHSCCMISETACENGNRMLDRGLVVPITNREDQSYFKDLVINLCQLEI